MEKYLLNLPKKLKAILSEQAKSQGYSMNGLILFILWDWVKSNGFQVGR